MAFRRLYPTKDTFVTNIQSGEFSGTYANAGASEILELFKTVQGPSYAHILMQFGTVPVIPSATYILHLADAEHAETLPFGYNAYIYPNEYKDWNEGLGQDIDTWQDVGEANWLSASDLNAWQNAGAYPVSATVSQTFHFDTGHEDMDADVSAFATASFGFFIQIDPSLEADANDYYIKKFHSRQTHFPTRKPYLEIRWDDHTGTLSTGSQYFLCTSGAFSGVQLDPRYSGSLTGYVTASYLSTVDPTGSIVAEMPDLKAVYDSSEVVTVRLQVRPKDWNPAVVATGSSELPWGVLTTASYRIVDDLTDEVVVPFGDHTRMSYDDSGSLFPLSMSALPTGSIFRFEFQYTVGSDTRLIPGDSFKFRVI